MRFHPPNNIGRYSLMIMGIPIEKYELDLKEQEKEMKEAYICDKCGEDFPSKKECLEHEKSCGKDMVKEVLSIKRELSKMRKEIKSLRDQIDLLMMERTAPSPMTIPTIPPMPQAPSSPWPNITWTCAAPDQSCNAIVRIIGDEK